MPSQIRSVRAPKTDWEKWDAQAKKDGKSRNNWIRLTLNDACQLAKATEKPSKRIEQQTPAQTPRSDTDPQGRAQALRDEMYPSQRERCPHRLMPGVYCKKCGFTR